MSFKAGFLFITLLVGSIALPIEDVERDMSIFFDHTDASARIVGGTTAGSVPFMVALTTGANVRNLLCGGSLVTTRHVLTAAHCIASFPSSLRGHVGTNRFASGGTTYTFASRINHPNYNSFRIKNDVGILRTSSNVALTGGVGLVALNFNHINTGVRTIAYGWGRTAQVGGSISQVLMTLPATVVDGVECGRTVAIRGPQVGIWNPPPVDPALEICTFNANARGMCNGDSGSPLMHASNNNQIGIVSWGIPCARNAPDMFVRISAFASWIRQNIA